MQNNVLRMSDLLNPAGCLTGTRLILAIAFPFFAHKPALALSIYLTAILTDMLDGWAARLLHQSSHTGAVLDGWVDKILHINAAWAMAIHGYMPGWWMWLWFSRELFQWAMVMTIIGDFRTGQVREQHTSTAGRTTATLLFFCFVVTLLGHTHAAAALTGLTGIAGSWAGWGYLRRHLDDRKRFR